MSAQQTNRTARIERETRETKIIADINIDGSGVSEIKTGIGFLDHMLECFSRHSLIDIKLTAEGDLHVDQHHTTMRLLWTARDDRALTNAPRVRAECPRAAPLRGLLIRSARTVDRAAWAAFDHSSAARVRRICRHYHLGQRR